MRQNNPHAHAPPCLAPMRKRMGEPECAEARSRLAHRLLDPAYHAPQHVHKDRTLSDRDVGAEGHTRDKSETVGHVMQLDLVKRDPRLVIGLDRSAIVIL